MLSVWHPLHHVPFTIIQEDIISIPLHFHVLQGKIAIHNNVPAVDPSEMRGIVRRLDQWKK